MKTLEDQMSFYAAYHQDARNKASHFVGGWALQLWGRVYEGRSRHCGPERRPEVRLNHPAVTEFAEETLR